ncbi:hypothetical protein LTR64_005964 [Lithohypha guttulata]|uniref:uncharacterized protein n=1 Tax=Lithohypha guttulata TaxID=1690604 RepID=UPI00315D31EB
MQVPPTLRRNLFSSHLSRRPAGTIPNASTDRMPDPFQAMGSTSHNVPAEFYQLPDQQRPLSNVYAPRLPPTRSLSPTKSQLYSNTNASIITLDPTTGRPQLPAIPKLPSRLPEGDEEEEGEDEEDTDDEDDPDEHAVGWRRMKSLERANASQHDLDLHSSSLIGGLSSRQTRLHELIDTSADGNDYRDYEKIESILSEMQSQQRAKARTAVLPDSSSSLSLETPPENGVSARTRGKARITTKGQAEQRHNKAGSLPRMGGVGATLNSADKDELLGLIMTSLSKRVQEADEEAWMFGDERTAANGVSVSGSFNVAMRDELEY